jgi:hypothetical protein
MGLIDLKTDLKSLKYGKDTIGGGYSGQPYIQSPIPDGFNNLGANEDFILRGGVNAIGDAATDIKRLTKMFGDLKSPNGLLFIAKQNLLSQTSVRTQTTDGANEGIYSPLNTLAQAGVVEIGGHLNKQGVNPFAETGAYANNIALYSVKVKPTQPIEDNRLARLYQLVSINVGDKLDGFILNNGPANVLTYSGGPGSILGVGTTNIRYASFRTGKQNPLLAAGSGSANYDYFYGKNSKSENQPVFLSERQDIPNYINNFKGSLIRDTNDVVDLVNDELLKTQDYTSLSPFVKNNGLITTVIPFYQRTTGSLKSVNSSSISVGGLQIDPNKPWIWSLDEDKYILPNNSVNKPQSGSLNNTWYTGSTTWTAKQDITNPNGSTYIAGKGESLDIKYIVEKSKGVTNKSKEAKFEVVTTFNNPSVYIPSGSGQPLLSSNNKKIGGTDIFISNGTITYNQEDLLKADPSKYSPAIKEDFRKVLRSKITKDTVAKDYEEAGNIVPSTYISYSDKNIGVKNLLGNPGQNRKNKNYSDFSKGIRNKDNTVYKALDLINAEGIGTDLSNDDLVQFRIKSLFTDGSTLAFRAFLGGITDSYTAGINTQQYTGRGENFYTYSGQTRKISLSWTIAALSREELLPMYKRLNYLASMTAPKYVNGFMQGPIVSLTVGGYIYNLPGYIEGFSVDIAEDATWDIAITPNGEKDNTISQLPHVVKVSGFNFTPLPNYLPEAGNAESRFISIVAPDGTSL